VSKIVLCVDDSATMQQVADITFRGTEFQYVGARNVDEALSKAKAQKPAVVLADSAMPGKSGYDLCEALKNGGFGDVPVVILVGNSAPYDAAKGTQVGADANLPKPWDTQTMLEKVQEIVAKGATAKPGAAAAGPAAAAAPAAAKAPVATTPAAAAAGAGAAPQAGPPRPAPALGLAPHHLPPGPAPPAGRAAPDAARAGGLRPPAAAAAAPTASPASNGPGIGGMNRSPMVAGNPTKRSALVERTLAKMASRLAESTGLEPGSPELLALLKLSAEVVERIVWEVVPDLAEQIIKENLNELAASRRS